MGLRFDKSLEYSKIKRIGIRRPDFLVPGISFGEENVE